MEFDIQERQRALLERIATEGVEIAYETAINVCRDPKSTSPARATAAATLFRVAGFFAVKDGGISDKEPHEMTADELARAVRQAHARANERATELFS